MKYLLLIAVLFVWANTYSQGLKVIEVGDLSEAELENMDSIADKGGWVHIRFEEGSGISNFSNKEYILTILMNCSDTSYTPKYLIEYSKHYRDGTFGYMDFTNSNKNKFTKTTFSVDDHDFGDPFLEFETEKFSIFHQAVKSGKVLTIAFFDMEYNPETSKDELSLNRSLDFKLGNSEFLDIPVDCNVFTQQTAPSEEALPAN